MDNQHNTRIPYIIIIENLQCMSNAEIYRRRSIDAGKCVCQMSDFYHRIKQTLWITIIHVTCKPQQYNMVVFSKVGTKDMCSENTTNRNSCNGNSEIQRADEISQGGDGITVLVVVVFVLRNVRPNDHGQYSTHERENGQDDR